LLRESNGFSFRAAALSGSLSLVKQLLRMASALVLVKAWPNGEKSLLLTAACKPFGRHSEEGNRMLPWMLEVARRILTARDDNSLHAEGEEDGGEGTGDPLSLGTADTALWTMGEEEKVQFAVDFRRELLLCCEAEIIRGWAEELEMLFDMADDELLEELGSTGALTSCPLEEADGRPLTRLLVERMPKSAWLQVDLEGRTPLFAAAVRGNVPSFGIIYSACPEALTTPCKGEYPLQRFIKDHFVDSRLPEYLCSIESDIGEDAMAHAFTIQNPADGFTCLRQAVEVPTPRYRRTPVLPNPEVLLVIRTRMPTAAVGLCDSRGNTAFLRYCELTAKEEQDESLLGLLSTTSLAKRAL